MGFVNWRSGAWLLAVGLLGLLLLAFGGVETPAAPVWASVVLVTLGVALTAIGVHNRLKGRR